MSSLTRIVLSVLLNLGCVIVCVGQNDVHERTINPIETRLEKLYHHKYSVLAFDVDKSVNNPTIAHGRIRNPYHTLDGCLVFLAEALPEADLNKPPGFIGIYKADSIVWTSGLLSKNFSSLSADVSAVDELNKDGKVEIVISQYSQPDGTTESLWIFSWDGENGQLIIKVNDKGESTITCIGDFCLKDVDGDGIYEIQGDWYKTQDFDKTTTVTYSWNGFFYGKWGKSSKYLLKGTRK